MGVCTFWKMLPAWAVLTSPNALIMPPVSIYGGNGRESKLRTCGGEKYKLPQTHSGYAGIINCLARQEWPDLSGYDDPEMVWRMNKKFHAGLIVASPDAARVETLLNNYAERFAHDFLAVMPPRQSSAEM